MLLQLNTIIVDSDPTYRQEMSEYLSSYGVEIVAQLGDLESLPAALTKAGNVQLVILNLEPHGPQWLRKLGNIPRQFQNVNFFVLSKTVDATLLMEAMQMGVREFIPLPINEETFTAALDRISQHASTGKIGRAHV